jgi:hypothetical protein
MTATLSQPRISIIDLSEEDGELVADELPLIVGGGVTSGEDDGTLSGYYYGDVPKLN